MSWKLMDEKQLGQYSRHTLREWRDEAQGGLLIFAEPIDGYDGAYAETIEKALEKELDDYRRPGGGFYTWPLHRETTRELLRWLHVARKSGWFDPTYNYSARITYEEIKEVLATRPHVPNKAEGRRRRQESARRGKKNKLRRRPNHKKLGEAEKIINS